MQLKKNYGDKLQAFQKHVRLFAIEDFFYRSFWRFFGIEIPPVRLAPMIVNFILLFSLIGLIGFAACLVILLYLLILGVHFDSTISLYHKLFDVIAVTSVVILVFIEASKDDEQTLFWNINNDEKKIWQLNWFERDIKYSRKLQYFFFGVIIIIVALFGLVFKSQFFKFSLSMICLIIIYESIKVLLFYKSMCKWKPIKLEEKSFYVGTFETYNAQKNHVKLYSLEAEYKYKVGKIFYYSSQIFTDESFNTNLIDSSDVFPLKRWISEHENIDIAYVNPDKAYQAVLDRSVSKQSFINVVATIFAAMLVLLIINIWM